jgi:hypothetical protein
MAASEIAEALKLIEKWENPIAIVLLVGMIAFYFWRKKKATDFVIANAAMEMQHKLYVDLKNDYDRIKAQLDESLSKIKILEAENQRLSVLEKSPKIDHGK